LITQVYNGEPWLGERQDNYRGAANKATNCYKPNKNLRIIAFQSDSISNVKNLKEDVRKLFDIDKHSIHITDTHKEAVQVSRMLFNDNSVHFLNYAIPYKYQSVIENITKFKKFIYDNNFDSDEVVIDSSMVLSLYGIREARDIDYLSINNPVNDNNDIASHDSELEYHQENKNELIFNPKYHFYYEGLKFISFDQVYRMKMNRSEAKDKNDIEMMRGIVERRPLKVKIAKIRQHLLYLKAKLRSKIVKIFIMMGLYNVARHYYRKLTGKKYD
jgi:hypothetical protein